MNKAILTIFKDICDVDLEHHKLLKESFQRQGFQVEVNEYTKRFEDQEEFHRFCESINLDRTCTVHIIGLIYQSIQFDIPLERASCVWFYHQGDAPGKYPHNSIQNTQWLPNWEMSAFQKTEITTIQMPYGFPLSTKRNLVLLPQKKDIDLLWIGSETVHMGWQGIKRKDWLDELCDIWPHERFCFDRCAGGLNTKDYSSLIQRSKIVLNLRGHGDYTFKLFEFLYLQCCVVSQPLQRAVNYGGVPIGVTMAESPSGVMKRCVSLIEKSKWFAKSKMSHQWYQNNYSEFALKLWADKTVLSIINSCGL